MFGAGRPCLSCDAEHVAVSLVPAPGVGALKLRVNMLIVLEHETLRKHAKRGARIGYDPLHFSEEAVQRYAEKGLALVATENNPIDAVWADQPAAPMAPALPHPIAFAGLESAKKRELVAASKVSKIVPVADTDLIRMLPVPLTTFSLKVNTTLLPTATPMAASAGLKVVTVGAVVSAGATVVKSYVLVPR